VSGAQQVWQAYVALAAAQKTWRLAMQAYATAQTQQNAASLNAAEQAVEVADSYYQAALNNWANGGH